MGMMEAIMMTLAGGAAAWDPSQLPSLKMWIDASDNSTITLSGSQVTQISDKATPVNHFSTSAGSVVLGTLNSIQALLFSGSNTLIFNTGLVLGANLSICAVMQAASTPTNAGPAGFDDEGSNRIAQLRWNSATAPLVIGFSGGTPKGIAGSGATSIVTTAQVLFGILDSSGQTVTTYVNNSQNGQQTSTGVLNSGSVQPRLGLADFGGGGSGFWNGTLGELIVCNAALGSSDRLSLYTYLKNKWGTP